MRMRFGNRITPDASRTIEVLRVDVPVGIRQVRVDLTYAPRLVEDRGLATALVRALPERLRHGAPPDTVLERFWPLRNLLNIAVFDPRGRFRGRWDRNRPEQRSTAVLAEQGSDAGMIDGVIGPGSWRLCLEIHQVLTPIEYELTVELLEAMPTPRPRSGPSLPTASPRRSGEPDRGGEWLSGELHVHSEHSDGAQPVREIATGLLDAGLDFFALTDHNTTSGLRDLPAGVFALPGLELTTFYGHATCIGVTEFIPWYDGGGVRPFREMAAQARDAGGLVTVAHPFAPPNPLCAGCRWEFPDFSWGDADLLEIWNGDRDEHAPINAQALSLWDDLLATGARLVAVAGSDMHDLRHLNTKRYARTLVWAEARSPSAVLTALRAGRAVVTLGPRVELEAISAGHSLRIGETVVVPRGTHVTIRGAVTGAHAAAEAVLVVGGMQARQRHAFEQTLAVEAPTYVRAQVMTDGKLAAVTNPIFIDVAS